MPDQPNEIAMRMKKLREDLGMTQKQFAEAIGFAHTGVHKYEKGLVQPSLAALMGASQRFYVSMDYLTFGKAAESAQRAIKSGSERCGTCKFWIHIDHHVDFPDKPEAHWGLCRRNPPSVGHAQDSGYGFNSDTPGGWPITDGSDWCGEHNAVQR